MSKSPLQEGSLSQQTEKKEESGHKWDYEPVVGQNLDARTHDAGNAATSLEYDLVQSSAITTDAGCGAPCW
jgi:hypothetical protein